MRAGFAVETDAGLESAVYGHFGSAPAFIIIDTEKNQIQTIANSNLHHVHGACNPIMALGGNALDAMIVGGIGRGALMKLSAMGIRIYRAGAETVKENLVLLRENRLQELSMNECCQGHGGTCSQ